MRRQTFQCKRCDDNNRSRCIYCGGEGVIVRETWETIDRRKHMSKIGMKQGPLNAGRRSKAR